MTGWINFEIHCWQCWSEISRLNLKVGISQLCFKPIQVGTSFKYWYLLFHKTTWYELCVWNENIWMSTWRIPIWRSCLSYSVGLECRPLLNIIAIFIYMSCIIYVGCKKYLVFCCMAVHHFLKTFRVSDLFYTSTGNFKDTERFLVIVRILGFLGQYTAPKVCYSRYVCDFYLI